MNWLAEIDTWVDTPYFTEGCTKGVKGGVNCIHWLIDSIIKVIPNGESVAYGMDITHLQFRRQTVDGLPLALDHVAFRVEWDNIQPGDIACQRVRRVAAIPAVYFGDDIFVYCDVAQKRIVKRALLPNLIDRVMYVYRLHAVTEEN
jgi:hypothetical protein